MTGRCPAITSATTLAPRLWRITWITTSSFWNTQVQPFWPSMRTPSEAVLPTVRADDAGAAETGQNGAGLGVEARLERQVGLGQRGLAMRAAGQAGGDGLIRHLGEPPTATLATEAALAGTGPARLVLAVRLLAPRRRQAGVVRRLRRNAEPGFQLHDPRRQRRNLCRQRLHLRPERMNERILLVMRERRQVGQPVHPTLESSVPWSRQALRRRPPIPLPGPGMSKYGAAVLAHAV